MAKTSLGWLELDSYSSNPTDTLSNKRGICFVGTELRMWDGSSWSAVSGGGGGANTALSNLSSVAINTSLISDTDSTDDLGSSSKYWRNLYVDRIYLNSTATLDGSTAGTVALTGDLTVSGATTVSGTLTVGGLNINGDQTVSGTLTVDELILDTDGVAPAGTNCYAVRDNAGDLTLNAVSGKEIHLAIAGTDEVDIGASAVDLNGNHLDNAGYLILNAVTLPAGTEVYVGHDNAGDLTLNALSTKSIHLAIAGTDEYDFSASALDMKGNALDNAGYVILNAATAPAGTEVYLVNDNTGDLTLNALSGKSIHLAVDGTDEYNFSASAATFGDNNLTFSTGYIQFTGAGYVDLGDSGYIKGGGSNPAASGAIRLPNATWIAARNAANGADINMISVDSADDVKVGADLQLDGNTLYGDDASGGNLILSSTTNATKGYVGIADGEEGLKIGGTADRATTVGTNAIHIFDGTAPAGTLTNGVSLYSEGGELKVLDAAGNSTVLSPHTKDGDYVIHSYSAAKDETITIHLEKLLKALIESNSKLKKFVKISKGYKRTITLR